MDGCMREMKVKIIVARLDKVVVACLFMDDTVLLAERKRELQSGG